MLTDCVAVARKERRRLEYEKNMEKLKKHHKEGNVKMDGSDMYAHGAIVPPGTHSVSPSARARSHTRTNARTHHTHTHTHTFDLAGLMHWFSDPEGMKSKRDAMLEKKCNKLQRMAELRKTREKRIDWPSDPSTAILSVLVLVFVLVILGLPGADE
jgi:hypothetical protein